MLDYDLGMSMVSVNREIRKYLAWRCTWTIWQALCLIMPIFLHGANDFWWHIGEEGTKVTIRWCYIEMAITRTKLSVLIIGPKQLKSSVEVHDVNRISEFHWSRRSVLIPRRLQNNSMSVLSGDIKNISAHRPDAFEKGKNAIRTRVNIVKIPKNSYWLAFRSSHPECTVSVPEICSFQTNQTGYVESETGHWMKKVLRGSEMSLGSPRDALASRFAA